MERFHQFSLNSSQDSIDSGDETEDDPEWQKTPGYKRVKAITSRVLYNLFLSWIIYTKAYKLNFKKVMVIVQADTD